MIELLILTSCINPPKQSFLKLADSTERLAQTIESLKFYISSNAVKNIVLCDGSGFDFSHTNIAHLTKSKDINVEILSFVQDFSSVSERGKGYGEGEIMAHIVKYSKLFEKCQYFVKVTGRLKIDNIFVLSQKMDFSKTYFNVYPSRYIGCVDTRLYGMKTADYVKYFILAYKNVYDSLRMSYEFCFTDIIRINSLPICYFPEVPKIFGISGTNNRAYKLDAVYYAECILTKMNIMNSRFASYKILLVRTISKLF